MGGKSSSSNDSSTTQTTTETNLSAQNSGVTTSDVVLQGQTVSYNTNFDPVIAESVAGIFEDLTGLVSQSLDVQKTALSNALNEVSTQTTIRESPNFAAIEKLTPIAILATVGTIIYFVFGKKSK